VATVTGASSKLGTILVDGAGKTLYLFEKDQPNKSACSGACVAAWPVAQASGTPKAGGGVRASLLGTIHRADGTTQVTYDHHPLYYYAGDGGAGQQAGQGVNAFGAAWYVVAPAAERSPVPDRDRARRASAATVPSHRGALARSATGSWVLRVATATALGIDAVVHWRNAPAYDAVRATVSQGGLFRAEAALAAAVGLLVLVRPRTSSWVAAVLVGASALAAVLLYRYVDLGTLGPLPGMYENTWQVPGKLLSAYAEGAAVVLAGLGLRTRRKHPGIEPPVSVGKVPA
jgi:predicted lipoprotein with Yx(FWY)xxD motif